MARTFCIYTLSLHDALPILREGKRLTARVHLAEQVLGAGSRQRSGSRIFGKEHEWSRRGEPHQRSEEHTSELQSHSDLVCRLLLEKKNTQKNPFTLEDMMKV